MASLSHEIATGILTKLDTIDGLTVRWFDDTDPEEGVAYLVLSGNEVTQRDSGGIYRTLTGHVGFTYGTELEEASPTPTQREEVDELVAKIEAALLEHERDIASPPDAEFSLLSTQYGHAGEVGGIFSVRVEWQCRYRHQATNPRVGA